MRNTKFNNSELKKLCKNVKTLIYDGDYDACEELICEAMYKYPHAPHPHNLYGILLEKKGKHSIAMNHFRAAWSLDPSFLPAKHNLNSYGSFFSKGYCAFDEDDIESSDKKASIIFDKKGIRHIVRN